MSKLMIANWKSNKNTHEVDEWLTAFYKEYVVVASSKRVINYDVVICPPFPFVMQVESWIAKSHFQSTVSLGVQDMSEFSAGSYTGAVSGQNVVDLGVKYAIIGHSERRKYFKETSLEVSKKVESCLEERITPIVCVDTVEIEAQAGYIRRENYTDLVVAYEPVEHVGTGIPQDVGQVLKSMQEVRKAFPDAKVIYGGSVNAENISQYTSHPEIEGFLVGAASLDASEFVQMMRSY